MRPKKPSKSTTPAKLVTNSIMGSSQRAILEEIARGVMSAVIARTRPIFARLEPSAFPTAKEGDPLAAAVPDTNISGADVPKETTVKPIMSCEIPRLLEIPAAPVTKRSAPHIRPAIAIISTTKKIKNGNSDSTVRFVQILEAEWYSSGRALSANILFVRYIDKSKVYC